MLARVFCLGGGRDPEWDAHAQYGASTSSARARVLELVAEELEERFAALGPAAAAAGRSTSHSQEAAVLNRRLYNVNLPSAELGQCRDLLRKLAAIDAARVAAEADQQQLSAQLKSAEAAHRSAEFARARAEAIATARGEALMHAQQATREAEQENLQLGELLRHCMERLGLDADLTPFKHSPLPAPPPGISDKPAAPVRQSIFSKQQLAAVAASINKLPPLHQHNHQQGQQQRWSAAEAEAARQRELEQRQQEEELQQLLQLQRREEEAKRVLALQQQERLAHEQAEEEAELRLRRSSRGGSRQSSRERGNQRQEQEDRAARGSLDADQLSGFTVYTNELEASDPEAVDAGEVVRPEPAGQRSRRTSAAGPERDSQGSGVQWRSISSAALSSWSGASGQEAADEAPGARELHELQHLEQVQQQQARQSQGSLRGSRGSSHQLRSSQEQATGATDMAGQQQQQPGSKLHRHARQLSRLVLPGLDASQLDSLVRIGASMQSPDQHLQGPQGRRQSPVEMVQQLLPPGLGQAVAQLDSSINPLQSNANAQAFLTELHAEWLRQSCGGGLEGKGGPALGGQAGSQLPGGYDFYLDSKFPGAGTWVSPSLAAMLAHKKGYNPLLDGGEPSPPSHIKAVFGTTEDREFYGPMAAHLNRREPGEAQQMPVPMPTVPQPPPARLPASRSSESVRGPERQPPSNRSSFERRRSSDLDYQQQVAAAAARQVAAAPPLVPAGLPHGSADPPPLRRQAALRSGFQPMGMHAQGCTALSAQAQPQQPRRSSVAASKLQGSASSGALADENSRAAVAGPGGEPLRGSGLPPRGQQHQQQQQAPSTKRSLDSMQANLGSSGASTDRIQASLHAVDAALAALRDANPHLSREQQLQRGAAPPRAVSQQQQQQQSAMGQPAGPQVQPPLQQYGHASGSAAAGGGVGRGGVPRPGAHHTRTRSLPEVAALDMPLAAMGQEQRRREALQPSAAGGRRDHRY